MGSFALTCCVSGLPIEGGDPVRFFLLSQSPYGDSPQCGVNDLWFPRVWPIRAHYNDYGSINDITDGKKLQQAWLDSFRIDLVERGWGDNSCHDTSTFKEMSFEHMLEALWEQRILVESDVSLPLLRSIPKKKDAVQFVPPPFVPPEGVPTMKRVEEVLFNAGFKRFSDEAGNIPTAVMVEDQEYGQVRVRNGGYGLDIGPLWKAEKVLKTKYATMISHGTGSYAHVAELIVRPLPNTKDFHGGGGGTTKDKKPLAVRQAMIREDVWKALCKIRYKGWDTTLSTANVYRKGAKKVWELLGKVATKQESLLMLVDSFESKSKLPTSAFSKDAVPFTVGLAASFQLVFNKKLPAKETDTFLDNAGEFAFIQSLLSLVRYQWRPSYPSGPQSGEWKLHESFLEALRKVAGHMYAKSLDEG